MSKVKIKKIKKTRTVLGETHAALTQLRDVVEKFLTEQPPRRLTREFFERADALAVAKELLHCVMWTHSTDNPPVITAGQLSEIEAYIAPEDPASHAYNGKMTPRTKAMYSKGGTAYVYCCYGVHSLINLTTNVEGIPHALLLRAMTPVVGLHHIRQRRQSISGSFWRLGQGPGCLAQGLGIQLNDNGQDVVTGERIWVTEGISVDNLKQFCFRRPEQYPDLQDSAFFDTLLLANYGLKAAGPTIYNTIRIGLGAVPEYGRLLEYRYYVHGDRSVSRFPAKPDRLGLKRKSGPSKKSLATIIRSK